MAIDREELLTWAKQNAAIFFDLESYHDFRNAVLSGAFDVDQTEVRRLRAALAEIKQLLNENRENDGAFQSWNHMQAWKVATQALSTTIEPTNAAKAEWSKAEGDGDDAQSHSNGGCEM